MSLILEVGKQYSIKNNEHYKHNTVGKCHTITTNPCMYVMQIEHDVGVEYVLFDKDLKSLADADCGSQPAMTIVSELKQIRFEFWSSLNPAIEWIELYNAGVDGLYKAGVDGFFQQSTIEVRSSLGERLTKGMLDIIGMERAFPEFDGAHYPHGTYRINRPGVNHD